MMKKKVFLNKIISCCVLLSAAGLLSAADMQQYQVPLSERLNGAYSSVTSSASKAYKAQIKGDYSDFAKDVIENAVSQIFNIQYVSEVPLTGPIMTKGIENLLKMMLLGTSQYVIDTSGQKLAVYENGNVYAELLKKMGLQGGVSALGGFVISSSIHHLFAAKLNSWIEESIKTFLGTFAKNMLKVDVKTSVTPAIPVKEASSSAAVLPVEKEPSTEEVPEAAESTRNFLFGAQKKENEAVQQEDKSKEEITELEYDRE